MIGYHKSVVYPEKDVISITYRADPSTSSEWRSTKKGTCVETFGTNYVPDHHQVQGGLCTVLVEGKTMGNK